jgi:hypothetical protein
MRATLQEINAYNERVVNAITNHREKSNRELESFFPLKDDKVSIDIQPKAKGQSSVKQALVLLIEARVNP